MKKILLLSIVTLLIVGCGTLKYDQEAGFQVTFDKASTDNVTALEVEYHPDGAIKSIKHFTTNATSVVVKDMSDAALKSLISKTGAEDMVGDRKGMLDNNSGVRAAGVTTEEKLSTVVEKGVEAKPTLPGL